ncbi:hypothetical protein VMCG_07172 [Cytospora schulzeri]|uniref:LrgB-like protein n=1 Tax=Cytospora schulzeri TaxID=448051 RepID=A0A423W4X4_9PEZI|nr:hypothetical protein VMCG_07172 [Valsa malicola]
MIVATTVEPSIKRRFWNAWNQPSETTRHYYNVLLAIVIFFIAQLLTCAWDYPFWITGLDFPGQVAAMIFVCIVMWASQALFWRPGKGLEWVYHRYLRAPTEVLNKHMSIGFTVPFLNLIRQPFPGADQVGLLTAALVVTGILNSIFVYLMAYHVQLTISIIRSRQRHTNVDDIEASPRVASHSMALQTLTDYQPALSADTGDHGASVREEIVGNETSRLDRCRKHISDASTLCTLNGDVGDLIGPKQAYIDGERRISTPEDSQDRNEDDMQLPPCGLGPTRSSGTSSIASQLAKAPRAIGSWMSQNVFLALSILVFLLVGLPMSFLLHNDLFLDVGFLFTVWLTFTSAQTRTKQHISSTDQRHKKSLAAIATLLNPVLWTSLFLVGYGLAKSGICNQAASGVVATFTLNNTISDMMGQHIEPSNPGAPSSSHLGHIPIGAGDIATSILNAGIVSWGLKLFEYRRQIISRGGVTVIITSLLASLFNLIAWPLLVNEMGVRPASYDLSFAARSVTIALGGPAMKSLGGDASVNAVGVVVNGICFQLVAGLFVGGIDVGRLGGALRKCKDLLSHDGLVWNGRWTTKCGCGSHTLGSEPHQNTGKGQPHYNRNGTEEMRYSSDATHVDDQRATQQLPPSQTNRGRDVPLPLNSTIYYSSNSNIRNNGAEGDETHVSMPDDVQTVAAGVTIGINAAAMGTAHLYEQNSHASPYSALSMTMFGLFTVLFAVKSPLTVWLVGTVGGA